MSPAWENSPRCGGRGPGYGTERRSAERDIESLPIPRPEGHLGDSHLLPDQRATDLLHRADGLQPAGHRSVGPRFRVHRLLRLVGRRAPPGVRPDQQALCGVQQLRGDQQLPAARRRGSALHRVAVFGDRGPPDGRDGVLRRGDRADLRRTRLRADPAEGLAAPPPGLQDRHHPPRRGGRRALGAQRPGPRRQLRGVEQTCHKGRPGLGSGCPDTLRGLGQNNLLHHLRSRVGPQQRGHDRPGTEDHEADQ